MKGACLVTNLIHRRDRAKRIPTKTNKQKNQQILKASQSLDQAEPESTLPLHFKEYEPIMFIFALESWVRFSVPPIRDIIQMLWLGDIGWYFSLMRSTDMPMKKQPVKKQEGWIVFHLRGNFTPNFVQTRSNSAPECSGSRMTPGRQGKCMHSELKLALDLNSQSLYSITDIFNICLLTTECSKLY